jgi:hypothetical protein
MCRTSPSPLTVAAVVAESSHASPEGHAKQRAGPTPAPGRPYLPWGMLAAIDLHGCEYARLTDSSLVRLGRVSSICDARKQAIARAEAIGEDVARPVSAPTFCLCKSRVRRGLAARMLLVQPELSGSTGSRSLAWQSR